MKTFKNTNSSLAPALRYGLRELIAPVQRATWGFKGAFGCKPTNVIINITSSCSMHCLMCGCWRNKAHTQSELTIDEWKRIISELRQWAGIFRLTLSGGEPLMRKDIWELLAYCDTLSLPVVVVTNGALLGRQELSWLHRTRLSQLVISIDSLDASTHDYLRGCPGLLNHISDTLRRLKREPRRFVLATNTVISKYNVEELGRLARGLAEAGVQRISFQPIQRTSFSQPTLWPYNTDLWPRNQTSIREGFKELLSEKKRGTPISHSKNELREFLAYFEAADRWKRDRACSAGGTSLHIDAYGALRFCSLSENTVGDAIYGNLRSVWEGETATAHRNNIWRCNCPCLLNCYRSLPLRSMGQVAHELLTKSR